MGLFSAIGDAVSSVANAVTDVADAIGLDSVAEAIGLDDMYDAVANLGVGGWLNDLSDSLGLPDWFGDVAGCVADAICANPLGAVANGLDALEDVAVACGEETLGAFLKAGANVTDLFVGNPSAFEAIADPASLFENLDDLGKTIGAWVDGDVQPYINVLDPAFTGGSLSDVATNFIIRA